MGHATWAETFQKQKFQYPRRPGPLADRNDKEIEMPLNDIQQKRRLTDRAHTVALAADVRDATKKLEQACNAAAEWANAQQASPLPGVHKSASGNAILLAARQAAAHGGEAHMLVDRLARAIDESNQWDERRSDAFPQHQHRAIA